MKPISRKLAKELQENFNRKFDVKADDTNAVWFSIDAIEKFIEESKAKAIVNGRQVDGLRFYFGIYPEDKSFEQEKQGRTTLFVTPTNPGQSSQSDDDQELDVMNYGGFGKPPRIDFK